MAPGRRLLAAALLSAPLALDHIGASASTPVPVDPCWSHPLPAAPAPPYPHPLYRPETGRTTTLVTLAPGGGGVYRLTVADDGHVTGAKTVRLDASYRRLLEVRAGNVLTSLVETIPAGCDPDGITYGDVAVTNLRTQKVKTVDSQLAGPDYSHDVYGYRLDGRGRGLLVSNADINDGRNPTYATAGPVGTFVVPPSLAGDSGLFFFNDVDLATDGTIGWVLSDFDHALKPYADDYVSLPGLHRWDLHTGRLIAVPVTGYEDGFARDAHALSPNGRTIAVSRSIGGGRYEVHLVPTAGGAVRSDGTLHGHLVGWSADGKKLVVSDSVTAAMSLYDVTTHRSTSIRSENGALVDPLTPQAAANRVLVDH